MYEPEVTKDIINIGVDDKSLVKPSGGSAWYEFLRSKW